MRMAVSEQQGAKPELAAFASWLGAAMQARGITMRELSRQLGVAHTTVRDWVSGTRPPELPNVLAIALAFGVESSTLVALLSPIDKQATRPTIPLPGQMGVVALPVYRQRAAATEGKGVDEGMVYVTIVPPPGLSKDAFGLEIEGDCMRPTLQSGQTVVVDQQASASLDDLVVARPNSEWIIKRLVRREGPLLVLEADNPAFPGEWRVDERDIVGVVVSAAVGRDILRRRP